MELCLCFLRPFGGFSGLAGLALRVHAAASGSVEKAPAFTSCHLRRRSQRAFVFAVAPRDVL